MCLTSVELKAPNSHRTSKMKRLIHCCRRSTKYMPNIMKKRAKYCLPRVYSDRKQVPLKSLYNISKTIDST